MKIIEKTKIDESAIKIIKVLAEQEERLADVDVIFGRVKQLLVNQQINEYTPQD